MSATRAPVRNTATRTMTVSLRAPCMGSPLAWRGALGAPPSKPPPFTRGVTLRSKPPPFTRGVTLRSKPPPFTRGVTWCSSNSDEEREVLLEQHALVEGDVAPGDLPVAVHPTEQIFALADQHIGLGLHPVAVDEEPALDGDLARRRAGRARR